MQKSRALHWLLLSTLLVSVVSVSLATYAQKQPATQEEKLTIPLGSTFEIIADSSVKQPTYRWALTRDRTFLQAGRNQTFRTRFTQPGFYLLRGEISGPKAAKTLARNFRIEVPQRRDAAAAPTGDLIETVPPFDAQNRIITSSLQQIVLFTPVREDAQLFALDLDTSIDSNGDGQPANDNDTEGTYFSNGDVPLYIWFASPKTERALRLTVLLSTGERETQELTLISALRVQQEEKEKKTAVQALQQGGGRVLFAVDLAEKEFASVPLLFQWDFGDGKQSLLDRPIHTYARNGVYTFSVHIRDLRTGKELRTIREDVEVLTAVMRVTEEEVPEEEEKEEKKEEAPEGGSILGLLLKVILVGGLATALGLGGMFVFAKIRKKGIMQKALKKAEESLIGSEGQAVGGVTQAPPLEIPHEEEVEKAEVPPPPKEPEEEEVEEEKPLEDLKADAEQAPSWLQPGLKEAEEKGETAATPPPPTLKETPAAPAEALAKETPPPFPPPQPAAPPSPPQQEAPEPSPAPPPPAGIKEELPSWLQTPAGEAQEKTPTPPPAPTSPEATAEAPAKPEPVVSETPAPAPEGEEVPPWLQPQPSAPAEAGQQLTPPSSEEMTEEELTKEERAKRKRKLKQKRYRENVKRRKQKEKEEGTAPAEEKGDEDIVAFIQAEDIEGPEAKEEESPEKEQNEGEEGKAA